MTEHEKNSLRMRSGLQFLFNPAACAAALRGLASGYTEPGAHQALAVMPANAAVDRAFGLVLTEAEVIGEAEQPE